VIQNESAFWFVFGCGVMGAMGPDGMSRLNFFWVSLSMGPFFSNNGGGVQREGPLKLDFVFGRRFDFRPNRILSSVFYV
jgi:hypothetical protein